MQQLTNLVESLGGWVVSSNSFEYGDGSRGNIQVRFPAEHFNRIMEEIKSLAIEVNSASSSGQDVTDEFVDLGSRLENLEITAERVRSFLGETTTVEEALEVNRELSRLEGEIVVIKGRMKFLKESATYSSVSVEIYPDEVAQPIEVNRWLPAEIAEDAIESLANTMQGVANMLIWLVIYIIPIGLIVGLPLFYGGRWANRKWRKKAAPAAESTQDDTTD